MTHSAADPPRKPRRLGLYLPSAIAVALIVAWSLAWLWLKGETERRIDAAALALRTHGGAASWASRRIGGYPFHLDADFTDLAVADGSGWALQAPTLRSEALALAPSDWLVATDTGVTLTSPGAAPVRISAPLLHASLVGLDQSPPRFSFVGDDLTFAVAAGAPAFPLASAKAVQIYTRPGPNDQGALLVEVDGGQASPGTALAALAAGKPVALSLEATFDHASAWRGANVRAAAGAWSAAGGRIELEQLTFSAGEASLVSRSGAFALAPSGALVGSADAQATLAGTTTPARLTLAPDGLRLDRIRLAPAPRVF